MEDKEYNEYLIWLKETLGITPDQKFLGVNLLLELKSMRDEALGLYGDTELVKIMKENGTFEKQKVDWGKYLILTFDEWRKVYKKK